MSRSNLLESDINRINSDILTIFSNVHYLGEVNRTYSNSSVSTQQCSTMASLGDQDIVEAEEEEFILPEQEAVVDTHASIEPVQEQVSEKFSSWANAYHNRTPEQIVADYAAKLRARSTAHSAQLERKNKIKVLKPIQEEDTQSSSNNIQIYKSVLKKCHGVLKINEIGPKTSTQFFRSAKLLK